jgi:hypothetical protein
MLKEDRTEITDGDIIHILTSEPVMKRLHM